jgi:hypothetical protein
MLRSWKSLSTAAILTASLAINANAAEKKASSAEQWGLKANPVELKSIGPMAFGPDGVLIVSDPQAATVYAISTEDAGGDPGKAAYNMADVAKQLAGALGGTPDQIMIKELIVNPETGNLFLGVSSGDKKNGLVKIDNTGKITKIALDKVASAKVELPNPPEDKEITTGGRSRNRRMESITDLAYSEGKVLVSGMVNATDASTVREIAFPFAAADTGTPVEIYHAAHGRSENNAAIRTFVPFKVNGEATILAGFTCTPLVKFPVAELTKGKKTKGTTVAELGNRNTPLDMFLYEKNGQSYLLMANSARGVMKIPTKGINEQAGLTEPVKGGGTAGSEFEAITSWQGVQQMDKLGTNQAVLLVKNGDSPLEIKTVELP